MLVRTRRHRINTRRRAIAPNKNKKNWREFFKEELKTHSEQGLYLKGLRLREGYTQEDLAKKIYTTQNNVSAMESGLRPIGKEMAQRLSKVFKVPYQRFL